VERANGTEAKEDDTTDNDVGDAKTLCVQHSEQTMRFLELVSIGEGWYEHLGGTERAVLAVTRWFRAQSGRNGLGAVGDEEAISPGQ